MYQLGNQRRAVCPGLRPTPIRFQRAGNRAIGYIGNLGGRRTIR